MDYEVKLTLDSINYQLEVNSSDPIKIYLPKKTPNREVITGLTENKFNAIDSETLIRLYIKTQVNTVPTVNIYGMDDDVSITTNGSLDLIPNSVMVVNFETTDGGNTWLITSCNESAATAEGAEKLAKAAQETANSADAKADTAIETANAATNNANTANANALSATEAANNAKSTAENALSSVNEAKETAESAASVANNAESSANDANDKASSAKLLAEGALKKESETAQTIDSDVILGKNKTLLVQKNVGGTIVGIADKQYDELTDNATSAGLEQLEIGSTSTLLCLNHCGAEFETAGGVTKTVDGHIRVDYRTKSGEAVKQDQLAYMSDIAAIITHIKALEKKLSVDTADLPALPEVLEL